MNTVQLTAIFEKFAGREVDTVNSANPANGRESVKIDPQDPALMELRVAIEDIGCMLRVFTPSAMMGTMDYRPNRVNITLMPDDTGIYRIPKSWKMG